jgi:hypothetical protein
MQIFENQAFDSESFRADGTAAAFCDAEFRKCCFQGCTLSVARKPASRSTVRNVKLVDCRQRGCSLHAAIVEDVLVDGFTTNGQLFQTWGAAFNRVILKGKIDRVMFSSAVLPGVATPGDQQAFDDANAEFYRNVEWALDISQGEFKELCIRGLPAHLIRRDPETQVLVTREKALQGNWKELEFRDNLLPMSLDLFLQREDPSTVLVAPKRHPKFRDYLADIRMLQQAGVAEPD